MSVFDKLSQIGVKVFIALFLISILVGQVLNAIFTPAINNAISIAQNNNYTLTVTALNLWSSSIGLVLTLVILSVLLNMIFAMMGERRGAAADPVRAVLGIVVFFILLGIIGFQLALPGLITGAVISDGMLATILNLLYGGLVLGAVYMLVSGISRKGRKSKSYAVLNILGK